jgi:hypothetical protein
MIIILSGKRKIKKIEKRIKKYECCSWHIRMTRIKWEEDF